MVDQDKSKQELIEELAEMRRQVAVLQGIDADRQRANEVLRLGQELHRVLTETMLQGVVHHDADGTIIAMNPAAEHILGKTREQFLGSSSTGEEHGTIREDGSLFPGVEHPAMVALRTGQPMAGVVMGVFNPKVGDYRWISIDAVPLFRPGENRPCQVYAVFEDITERKQAEDALREREARLLEAQEVANLGFNVVDLATGRITTSPVLDQIFGIPVDYERTLDEWANLVHPDDRQEMLDYLKEVVVEKKPFDREYRIVRHGDKQVRWVHGRGRLHFNKDGQPISILGTVQDITGRKLAEEALQKAHEELEQRVEERTAELTKANQKLTYLASFPERNPHPIIEVSLSGDIRYVNAAAQRLFPELPEQALKHPWLGNWEAVLCQFGEGRAETAIQEVALADRWYQQVFCYLAQDEVIRIYGLDVTERKQAEDALRTSEEKYRGVVEACPDAIIMSDLSGQVQFASRQAWKLLGLADTDELVGRSVFDYVIEYDRKRLAENMASLVEAGVRRDTEYTSIRLDGATVPVEASSVVIRDAAGQPQAVMAVIRDITERKRAEEKIRQSHELLQAIIDNTPALIYVKDLEGRVTIANRALCEAVGGDMQDVLGKTSRDVTGDPEDAETHMANDRRVIETRQAILTEESSFGRVFLSVKFPLKDAQGHVLAIGGVSTDITERKQAEEALRQSERRFRNYFDQGLIGMAVTSVDKRWLEVNDRLCEILGYSREELLQRNWVELTYPDDIEPNLQLYNPLLKGEIEHFTLNKRYVKKGGSIVYATIHTRAFRKDDGTIDHIVTLIEDITARKQAEEALGRERQSLWRMLQASDHERQIISYEIHDGLAQYLAAAGMQFQAYESLRENLPVEAKKAYETAVELVRQAHAESRRLINEVRPPVIDEIGLETAISHLVHEQRKRGGPAIECRSDVRFGKLLPILENALYRIAQEALTNACKHSKSKKVTVTLVQEGQEVRLAVQDWGIGFDSESVKEGHFGLEGIRQRVRLLGGRLTIESKPNSGTLVQVVVPILEKPTEG